MKRDEIVQQLGVARKTAGDLTAEPDSMRLQITTLIGIVSVLLGKLEGELNGAASMPPEGSWGVRGSN